MDMDISMIPLTPAALADPAAGSIRMLYCVEENLWDALDLPYTTGMTFRHLRALAAARLNTPHITNLFYLNMQTGEPFDLDEEATPCSSANSCCIALGFRGPEVLEDGERWEAYLIDASIAVEFVVTYALLSVSLTTLRWRGVYAMLQGDKTAAAPQLAMDIFNTEGIGPFLQGSAFSMLTVGCCTALGSLAQFQGMPALNVGVGRALNNAVLTAVMHSPVSGARLGLASAFFYVPSWARLRTRLATVPASALWSVLTELISGFVSAQYESRCLPLVFEFGLHRHWNMKHPIAEILLDTLPKVLLLHPVAQAERCIAVNLPHTGPLHTLRWLYASGNVYTFVWQEVAMQAWVQIALPRINEYMGSIRERRTLSLSLRRGMGDRSVRLRVALEALGRVAAVVAAVSGLMWFLNRSKEQQQ